MTSEIIHDSFKLDPLINLVRKFPTVYTAMMNCSGPLVVQISSKQSLDLKKDHVTIQIWIPLAFFEEGNSSLFPAQHGEVDCWPQDCPPPSTECLSDQVLLPGACCPTCSHSCNTNSSCGPHAGKWEAMLQFVRAPKIAHLQHFFHLLFFHCCVSYLILN